MVTSFITTTTYFANNIMIQRQVSLARAVVLANHAGAIIPPDTDLLEVRCLGRVFLVPAQIIFSVNRAFVPRPPRLTRHGIWQRDRGICAYCGTRVSPAEATIDHVLPRAWGGLTSWENLVIACRRCNERKADRTPAEARMPLLFEPHTPKVRLRPE